MDRTKYMILDRGGWKGELGKRANTSTLAACSPSLGTTARDSDVSYVKSPDNWAATESVHNPKTKMSYSLLIVARVNQK